MTKFKPGDIVEYVGGYGGGRYPTKFLGSLGIVTKHDAFVRVDWIAVADPDYASRIHGVNEDNLVKVGQLCPNHSIA